MRRCFGKSFIDLLYLKDDFIANDQKWMNEVNRVSDIYCQQPLRKACKVCGRSIENEDIYFKSHGVGYKLCANCGNLNGIHEDTIEFCKRIYSDEDYGTAYYSGNEELYLKRVHAIYLPKSKFLVDNLNLLNEATYQLKYLECGAGCGYMVSALRSMGIDAHGVDASAYEVEYGNKLLKGDYLKSISADKIYETISETESEVLIFISTFEHLQDLNKTFSAINANKRIKYIYFNVPLFSFTCILELINQKHFNRHLGGGHTHLFTKSSLDWIYKEYRFTPVAVWDFGSEIMDLRRFMALELLNQKENVSERLVDDVLEFFKQNGDEMQLAIDRSGFASETHVLLKTESGSYTS